MKTCPYVKNGIKYRISGKNWKNSEKFGKIRKNSEKFGKIQKFSEKFRKFWDNSRKIRKILRTTGDNDKSIPVSSQTG